MRELAEKLFLIGMNDAASQRLEPTPENIQAVAKVAIDIAAEFELAWVAHPAAIDIAVERERVRAAAEFERARAEEDDEPYLGARIG